MAEGSFADLAIFGESGVSHVVLNGELAVKDGRVLDVSAGKILKKLR